MRVGRGEGREEDDGSCWNLFPLDLEDRRKGWRSSGVALPRKPFQPAHAFCFPPPADEVTRIIFDVLLIGKRMPREHAEVLAIQREEQRGRDRRRGGGGGLRAKQEDLSIVLGRGRRGEEGGGVVWVLYIRSKARE